MPANVVPRFFQRSATTSLQGLAAEEKFEVAVETSVVTNGEMFRLYIKHHSFDIIRTRVTFNRTKQGQHETAIIPLIIGLFT